MSEGQATRTGEALRTRPWPGWPAGGAEEQRLLAAAVDDGVWSAADGPRKLEFERRWAEFTGSRKALGVTTGTIALELALRALGVGAGDEVVVPPYTFYATATAALAVNALPVFADIDPDTYNLDPAAAEAAVTDRTRAVIAVHLAGQPADLDALRDMCDRRGLALVEDAAHAPGARWRDRPVGAVGEFAMWSFQASKNLTSGEGGALTTDDLALAESAWELHNCGRRRDGVWYEHHRLGGNYRLPEWQAAVLLAGLDRLPSQLTRREECAASLDAELAEIPGIRPLGRDPRATLHAHHLYVFRYDPEPFGGLDRDGFADALRRQGIPAMAGYPIPLYRQPLFEAAAFDRRATGWTPTRPGTNYGALNLPVCERACAEAVWLPHSLLLAAPEEMADVVAAVRLVQREATR